MMMVTAQAWLVTARCAGDCRATSLRLRLASGQVDQPDDDDGGDNDDDNVLGAGRHLVSWITVTAHADQPLLQLPPLLDWQVLKSDDNHGKNY